MEINNILIASDFSKHADYSLTRAVTLAEQHKATLHFLHVLQQPLMVDFGQYLSEQPKDFLSLEKETLDKLSVLIMKYPTSSLLSHFNYSSKSIKCTIFDQFSVQS